MTTRPYPSIYAHTVVAYVAANPGCSKWDVARHVTYRRNPSKSYHIVNTAIRHGAIRAVRLGNRYSLSI